MGKKQNVHGEGNYEATRKYNEGLRNFIRSGRVGRAARDAAPATDADELQMAAAESEGKRRAKEEDPSLSGAMPKAPVRTKPDDTSSTTAPETPAAPKPGKDEP
ncbi:MAG TPA: hypothetical protein VGK44_15405 [Casimicrobiaceae bacterium]